LIKKLRYIELLLIHFSTTVTLKDGLALLWHHHNTGVTSIIKDFVLLYYSIIKEHIRSQMSETRIVTSLRLNHYTVFSFFCSFSVYFIELKKQATNSKFANCALFSISAKQQAIWLSDFWR